MKEIDEVGPAPDEPTPGPWRWELNLKSKKIELCGGVPRYDLSVMRFVRWGMTGAAPQVMQASPRGMNIMHHVKEFACKALGREHHADWFQTIDHPDMRLIEAAPDLLQACRKLLAYHQWAKSPGQWDSEPEDPEAEVLAAIAKTKRRPA